MNIDVAGSNLQALTDRICLVKELFFAKNIFLPSYENKRHKSKRL